MIFLSQLHYVYRNMEGDFAICHYYYGIPSPIQYTGCIRKNCAVGSFGTISEPDGLSSRIIYQMKAEIDIQNWVNLYENPTDTN